MQIKYAERLNKLPKYTFSELDKLKEEQTKKGVDMISLAIGDPDIPTHEFIRNTLAKQALDPKNHNYPSYIGEKFFREAVAQWMKKRFEVEINSENEVIALTGAKEGIANIGRAFVEHDDVVLCPDPGYPVYPNGTTILCDGTSVKMPLLEENNFLPDFDEIKKQDAQKAVMIFLNYPNNPTGAVCEKNFLEKSLEFCRENNIILAYDNAYSELTFGEYSAPSILEIADEKDLVIEFHSFSKTFCMTGDRLGFGVGNSKVIEGLGKVKENIDSGVPVYIQKTGAAALELYKDNTKPKEVQIMLDEYSKRAHETVKILKSIGLNANEPKGTIYVWINIKRTQMSSIDFVKKAMTQGVVLSPGTAFGEYGEGYIRLALTQPIERIKQAIERLEKII